MSKIYRHKGRRVGAQTVHKSRRVHALDDAIPLEQLIEEIDLIERGSA